MTDKMKGLSSDMMKFSNTELVKMIGLLGKDNVNGAGVGAANTAVAVASARGDASTMAELKSALMESKKAYRFCHPVFL